MVESQTVETGRGPECQAYIFLRVAFMVAPVAQA
jgi:hypothetical protein